MPHRRYPTTPEVEWPAPDVYPTVVALDPGGTTGWCVMAVHPDSLTEVRTPVLSNITHWTYGEFIGQESKQEDECFHLMAAWEGAAIVVEDYVLRHSRRDRESLSPVRLTAVIRYCARQSGRPIYTQSPALAKTTVTDARLREWGLYRSGSEHARDAVRHALTWFRRVKAQPNLAAKTWPDIYNPY